MSQKMAPHNEQAERAVLGALLIDPAAYPIVASIVTPADFFNDRHRFIFEAIEAVAREGMAADFVTVSSKLEQVGQLEKVGGAVYLTDLIAETPSSVHAQYYARIIKETATRRQLLRAAGATAKAAYDEELTLDEVLGQVEGALALAQSADEGKAVDGHELMGDLYQRMEYWANNPLGLHETRGLPTRIEGLDKALDGLEAGLYVVAGRPSMGKTALVLQIAGNVASQGRGVLFFTLEGSAVELGLRLICAQASVEKKALRRGLLGSEELQRVLEAAAAMTNWPLRIREGVVRPSQVRALGMQEMARGNLALIIADGLWLMASGDPSPESRTLELGNISRGLKLTANYLGVPIIAVHQLSRKVEQRNDKRPILSDLRDSGRVEEDADQVWMLYRDGYYNPGSADANVLEVWVRKDRLGGEASALVRLFWNAHFARCEALQTAPLNM